MPEAITCTGQSESAPDVRALRLGVVPYLNVQPLIWKFRQTDALPVPVVLHSAPPRLLAEELRVGKHDAAIVPIFEYFRHPGHYEIIPGIAIGCDGPVRSVMLYANVPLENLRSVYLDPASLTSVNLLKVLLGEMGLAIEYREGTDARPVRLEAGAGCLLIGDPALEAYGRYEFCYDLGDMWLKLTGLPFVFAVWLAHAGSDNSALVKVLQDAALAGIASLELVAAECAQDFGVSIEFALEYFRNSISYALGQPQMQAVELFRTLCTKYQLVPA